MSSSKSFVSKAIKWITKSEYSHASVLVGELYDHYFKFEAQSRGVIPYILEEKSANMLTIIRINAPYRQIQEAINEIFELKGKRYLYENFIGFALSIAINKAFKSVNVGIKTENFMTHGYWCSKLVQCYINLVLKKVLGDPDNCTPEDLNKLVKSRPDLFEVVGTKAYDSDCIVWK